MAATAVLRKNAAAMTLTLRRFLLFPPAQDATAPLHGNHGNLALNMVLSPVRR
jgi:hypothetical protein